MADRGVEGDLLSEIQNAFNSNAKNLLVQNVGTQYDPLEVCLDRKVAETVNHVYKHKVWNVHLRDIRTFRKVACIFFSIFKLRLQFMDL